MTRRSRKKATQVLRNFMLGEMKKRDMSARQLAELIGVSSSTVNAYLNGEVTEPTLPILRKISIALKVPLRDLLAIAYPETASDFIDVPPDVMMLARQFADLPEDIRNVIRLIVSGQQSGGGTDKQSK